MKRLLFALMLLSLISIAWSINTPRVYFGKVTLANGKLPSLTVAKKTSAKEYIFTASILENKGDVMSTETNPVNSVVFKYAGDDKKMPKTAVVVVQLGNFANQWKPGQTLHLQLTHKATKKKIAWDVYIPNGTNTINELKNPVKLPKEITK